MRGEIGMPENEVIEKANEDLREGKSPSTAAGEFVHEEFEHVREGKHGARSPQQAIAIGLTKARRAGIPLKPPAAGKTSKETKKNAEHHYNNGKTAFESHEEGATARGRSRMKVMKHEPKNTASHAALSRHSKEATQSRRKASTR